MRFYYPLFAGSLIMVAALLLITQLINIHLSLESRNWKATEAQVITWKQAGQLGAKFDAVGAGLRAIMLPGLFAFPYLPYSYIVGNKMYAAVNYTYSIDPLGPKQQQVDAEYPIGAKVTVYVNPLSPEDAVVRQGLNDHFYINILVSFLMGCTGIYWLSRRNTDNVV